MFLKQFFPIINSKRSDRMFDVILMSLVFGAVFALFALCFSFTYKIEGYITFSHIALFLIGVLLTGFLYSYLNLGKLLALAILIPILAIVGFSTYLPNYLLKKEYNRHYNRILLSIAVLALIHGILGLIFAEEKLPGPKGGLMIGKTVFTSTAILTFGIFIIILLFTLFIVAKTRFGKALRAMINNRQTAVISGINPDFISTVSNVYISIIAGVAGYLFALNLEKTTLSLLPGFKAVAIAIIGNFGALLIIIASFLVVLIEKLANFYFPGSEYYSSFIVFGLLLLVMLFRIPGRGRA